MSEPILKHYGRITHIGEIKFYNEPQWEQQRTALKGKEFVLRIQERKNRPSKDQYGYYFGGILFECHISEKFAHFDSPEEIHELIIAPKFLKYSQLVRFKNESWIEKKTKRLSSLSDKEMAEFIERVLAFLAEEEIYPKTPEEYYLNYYKTVTKKEGKNEL